MKKDNFYITTPIYYPNGNFHVGNCYSTIICDVIARYKRFMGFDVLFTTGNDEHGLKIEKSAKEADINTQEYVDEMAKKSQDLWEYLNISNDKFVRTTNKQHIKLVQDVFEKLKKNNDIYKGIYKGWYSFKDEEYFTEKDLKEIKYDNFGNIKSAKAPSGHEVELLNEECYFFNIKKYEKQLRNFLNDNLSFLSPNSRLKEIINNFLKPGLQDLAITRSTFKWGIKLKTDPKHVIYVWLDALLSYLSATGYNLDDKTPPRFWPPNIQVIGKEITRFHVIYWPIVLMSLNLPLPNKILAHGWIESSDGKMSKSKNNIIYPKPLIDKFGSDSLRYYLLSEISIGEDGIFNIDNFVNRYNFDLVNDLGNLVNRTISMINKYFQGNIQSDKEEILNYYYYKEFTKLFILNKQKFFKEMENYNLTESLKTCLVICNDMNKVIEKIKPWKLAQDNDYKNLELSLVFISNYILKLSSMFEPFLPNTSLNIYSFFTVDLKQMSFENIKDDKIIKSFCIKDANVLFPRLKHEEAVAYINNYAKQ